MPSVRALEAPQVPIFLALTGKGKYGISVPLCQSHMKPQKESPLRKTVIYRDPLFSFQVSLGESKHLTPLGKDSSMFRIPAWGPEVYEYGGLFGASGQGSLCVFFVGIPCTAVARSPSKATGLG